MVLLIIDTQEQIMTPELYKFTQFVEKVQRLLAAAREQGIEVIYIRHDDGTELTKGAAGFDVDVCFAPQPEERIFDKHVNSPFKESGLLGYLRERGEKQIIVAGIQTDYCVDATVKCGFEHGFTVLVPAHCNTTTDNEWMTGEETYRYYNEKMWKGRYAQCMPLEDLLNKMRG